MFTRGCRRMLVLAGVILLCLTARPDRMMADTNMELEFDDDSGSIGLDWTEELPGSPGGSGNSTAASDGEGGSVPSGVCPNYEYELVDSDSGHYQGAFAGERPSEEHRLMGRSCTDPGSGSTMVGAEWVLVGEDGVPAVDPAVLAVQAVDSLQLPRPQIKASPEAAQLVYLPVWMWLEGTSWSSQSASASVPGLTVTASAVPVRASWEMGDGTTVTCAGPGTVWERGVDARAASPDCGHVYALPSIAELRVTVTVSWEVTWSGGGASGSVPGMVTSSSVTWPVVESHALMTS